jgi:hypothetical protein
MRVAFSILIVLLFGGCSSMPGNAARDIPAAAEIAMKHLYVGMTEDQALEIMKPVSRNWGRLTYGGTGAGELIFDLSATWQVRLDVEPAKSAPESSAVEELNPSLKKLHSAPQFVVTSIRHPEPKTKWILDTNHNFLR